MNENKFLNKFVKSQKNYYHTESENIKHDQNNGLYPKFFSFPVGIQFEITAKCNLSCKHCYNRSDIRSIDIMTIKNLIDVVDDIIESGGIFQCIISGGEPFLLGNSVFKIMDPLNKNGTAFVIITNGYFIDIDIVERLRNFEFYWIQVSIDNVIQDLHDEFRGLNGSWSRAVHAAELFSSYGFPLRIAHSVTPENVQSLEKFIDFAYLLGASSVVCGEVMLSGRAASHKELLMNDAELNYMYKIIELSRNKYNGRMNILASAPDYITVNSRSTIPNSSVIIRPNGDVRLDCTMPFIIGNVLEKKFSDIWLEHGKDCWTYPEVLSYRRNFQKNKPNKLNQHINHISPDIRLY
jgi:MoaA/NifB/PqqE/SkfB family radical SAM enzyme